MKNACFALIGFLATAAFADLTPNTIIDNVPGDTTLSNLVAASGVKSVEIDPTLSEEGKAADAKKVKEALNGKLDAYNGVAGGLQVGNYHQNPALVVTSGDNTYGKPTVIIHDKSISPDGDGAVTGLMPSSRLGDGSFVGIELPNRDGTLALTSDIPAPVAVIDPAVATTTGKAADALKVKEALAGKRGITDRVFVDPGSTFPFSIEKWVVRNSSLEFVIRNPSSQTRGRWEISTGEAYPWIDGEKTSDGWRFEFWDVLDEPELLSSWSGSDITNASLENGNVTPVIITDTLALTSDIPAPYTPPPYLRVYDEVRQCWWRGRMVDGVMNWEVE